ncbi:RNA methyltransferase [Iamia sp. SCSIO 61187]|uniref:TrmH family RNA methyltransferase n=1 Tax=Iamia sp. SCSIO 61187 TaxID=2722752 RepID=UPI001C62BC77|nr:RNA methyltransferase [Iamia sp. SCSIO 61187]QYG92086.1 RNA methyltransferase [Iamia sp. SCSIO 61187]
MAEPIRIDDPADARLEDYRTLTDPALRKRYEAERGVFIVESALAVEALAASPHASATRSVLVGERRLGRMAEAMAALAAHGAAVYTAPAAVLEATAGFPLHRGVVASVTRPAPVDPGALTARARTVLAVEGVNDHENLGALFRSAAAFGADAVLLDPSCADPWYRRCVRVSMGHVLQVPHARAPWPDTLVDLAGHGWRVVALTPSAPTLLHAVRVPAADERVVVVVGAEGPGLDPATLAAPGVTPVRIAMAPGVDSLNVAMAATVALAHLRAPTLS